MNITELRIQDGTIDLPARLRARYKLAEGDAVTLVDLGGVFVLSPKVGTVSKLAKDLEKMRQEAELSMTDLLEGLNEQRRIYAAEKYGIDSTRQTAYRRGRSGGGRVLHDRS